LCPAAYNEEIRKTLGDKRLQDVLLKVDGAANREQVGLIRLVRRAAGDSAWLQANKFNSSLAWTLTTDCVQAGTLVVCHDGALLAMQALQQAMDNPDFREFADKVRVPVRHSYTMGIHTILPG
jgi:hypothetical protein